MIYLFPLEPFTKADIKEAQRHGLTILGKNNYEGSDNLVVKGSLRALKNYAENYLGYELIPEYLYGDSRFDMDIEDMTIESFEESTKIEESKSGDEQYEEEFIKAFNNIVVEDDGYTMRLETWPGSEYYGYYLDDSEMMSSEHGKIEDIFPNYMYTGPNSDFGHYKVVGTDLELWEYLGAIGDYLFLTYIQPEDLEDEELYDKESYELGKKLLGIRDKSNDNFDWDAEQFEESRKLEEGTGNFKMSSKGFPTYVYPEDDEALGEDEDNALLQEQFEELQQEAEYFSEAELQDYVSEVVEKMVNEGLITEDEADYVIIEFGGHVRLVVEPGYYSSYSLSIQKPYDTPTNRGVREEVMKKVEDAMVDAALEKAASLAEEYGLRKIKVSARFSSGETWYQFEESTKIEEKFVNYSDEERENIFNKYKTFEEWVEGENVVDAVKREGFDCKDDVNKVIELEKFLSSIGYTWYDDEYLRGHMNVPGAYVYFADRDYTSVIKTDTYLDYLYKNPIEYPFLRDSGYSLIPFTDKEIRELGSSGWGLRDTRQEAIAKFKGEELSKDDALNIALKGVEELAREEYGDKVKSSIKVEFFSKDITDILDNVLFNIPSSQNSGVSLFKYKNKIYMQGDFSVEEAIEEVTPWDSEEECAETIVGEYIEASGEDVDTETALHAINVLANELGDRKNWKKSQIEESSIPKKSLSYVDPMILVDINWLQEHDENGYYFDDDFNPLEDKIRKDFKVWIEPNDDEDSTEYPYNLYASLPKLFAYNNNITLIDSMYRYPYKRVAYIQSIEEGDIEEGSIEESKKLNEYFSWSDVDEHLEEIKAGATFENGKLAQYDSGYQVAWHQSKEVILNDLEEVKEYVNQNNLKNFGIWFDNGKYVLDTDTVHVDDLERAIKIAKEANQKAIFDWKNMKSIYIKDVKESVSEGEKLVRLQTITEEELDEWFEEELIIEWDSTLYNLLSEESAEELDNGQSEDDEDFDDDDDEEFEFRQKLEDLLRYDWYEKFSLEEKKEIYANNCVDFMNFDEDPMKKYKDAGIEIIGYDDEDDDAYVKESSGNERMIEYRIAKHDMNRVISTLKNKYREKNWKWVGGLHNALPYTNDDYYIIVAPNTKEFEWLNMYKPVISESIKESVKNGFMLVDSEGNEVNIGDEVTDFRGVKAKIVSLMPPHNSASTGRLEVDYGNGDIRYLYAKVFNLYYVDVNKIEENTSSKVSDELTKIIDWLDKNGFEYQIQEDGNLYMPYENDELLVDMKTGEVYSFNFNKIEGNIDYFVELLSAFGYGEEE